MNGRLKNLSFNKLVVINRRPVVVFGNRAVKFLKIFQNTFNSVDEIFAVKIKRLGNNEYDNNELNI